MLAQLRLLDPSASAEVGTPERALLDTVAAAVHENQIDLTLLEGQLDFNTKFGANLDRFFQLFRFSRQAATFAEGYVVFGRQTVANQDILIPAGTLVRAPALSASTNSINEGVGAQNFQTLFAATLVAGQTETSPVPVRAVTPGPTGNIAAERITTFVNEPVIGITTVNNEQPFSGGKADETDDEFKTRFKNTVFRNLAGTQDQYLALALALAFSTKANVVGPISRYREYIQVPPVADNLGYDVDGDLTDEPGNGSAGEYSTAMTTNPYAKHVWDDASFFVSNGDPGAGAVFYRNETDFRMNLTSLAKYKGDAYRFFAGATIPMDDDPRQAPNRPTLTFFNVYTGSNADLEAIRPEDVVLLEYSYMSDVSRNTYDGKILNCVDVFVNGENPVVADCVIPRPSSAFLIVDNTSSKYHYNNFRRYGEPEHRPLLGNTITPLFWEPVIDLPDSIEVEVAANTYVFTRGIHYWLVEDVSEYSGTVRSRSGIEWATGVPSQATADDDAGPYTGPTIFTLSADAAMPIEQYTYDRNIVDLQGALEANKQVTTDVLAHKSHPRFFKFDITVMYTSGASATATNLAIRDAITTWFEGQNFGTVVQLSDVLQVVHNVSGVDNVRWSTDVPGSDDLNRVQETDASGLPLANVLIDRRVQGHPTAGTAETQQLVITGSPTGGTFKVKYNATETAALAYNINAATLQTALRTASGDASLTVTGAGTPASPFIILFSTTALRSVFTLSSNLLTGGSTIYDSDFILKDNELPALPTVAQASDSVPGLIIRPRAQHTWIRR
jgi:uncharacterized phage protein gp47/JayE